MTSHEHEQGTGCLLCAVRAMTEGVPPVWWPDEPETITGVILRKGSKTDDFFGSIGFIDLWLGGGERRRLNLVRGLNRVVGDTEPQIGDTLTVNFEGIKRVELPSRFAGHQYRVHSASIVRGHHGAA